MPLTGRSSYLLLARELSYRLNEMAFNTNATYDQYMEAYKMTLQTIENVAKIEAANITQSSKIEITTAASSSIAVTDSRENKNDHTETVQDTKSETETEQEKSANSSTDNSSSTDN